jgi:hypothetical protein
MIESPVTASIDVAIKKKKSIRKDKDQYLDLNKDEYQIFDNVKRTRDALDIHKFSFFKIYNKIRKKKFTDTLVLVR